MRNIVNEFDAREGYRKYNYKNCGRKAWKMTADVEKYVIRRLLAKRVHDVVTSVSLQADVARDKGIEVDAATLRKLLKKRGYKWLPRSQKRKYSKDERKARLKFARAVLRLTMAALKEKLGLSLDGVVLTRPPENETDRYNYCWGGELNMWRKPGEANLPKLAGDADYLYQAPIDRCFPLWGGISEGGAAAVLWHSSRKTNQQEWSNAVRGGKLTDATRKLNPRAKAPHTVLCDGESFLRAKESMKAYRSKRIVLWSVPPKSPDLNPVELFWGWLRTKLRRMDLADMRKKRKALGKTGYTARIKGVISSNKAQTVAKNFAKRLRKTCQQVVLRKGAASDA